MSYAGRYSTQAPSVSDIDDSWYPPAPPRRRCSGCACFLRQGNIGRVCAVCERKKPVVVDSPARFNNSVGLKGVMRCGAKFKAQRQVHGMKKHLGVFDTAQEAHQAWRDAR